MSDDAIREALAEILSTMPKFPDPGTPNESEASLMNVDITVGQLRKWRTALAAEEAEREG